MGAAIEGQNIALSGLYQCKFFKTLEIFLTGKIDFFKIIIAPNQTPHTMDDLYLVNFENVNFLDITYFMI